ncbi:MAG: Crp/Fnr family transcriptional regulator [Armatimonadota bacterium]
MTEQNFLDNVALLADLAPQDRERLTEDLDERIFQEDELIFDEDDTTGRFFLIKQGEVKISIRRDGREVTLTHLRDGDFFGEMSILDGEPRSARATAVRTTIALIGDRDDFFAKLRQYPQIALNLLTILSKRLRQADQQIEDLSFLDVQGRVARLLLNMADEIGRETELGTLVPLEHTRQELASFVSTSRETLTRVLKQFERLGYIRLGRRKVMITNVPRLRRKTV